MILRNGLDTGLLFSTKFPAAWQDDEKLFDRFVEAAFRRASLCNQNADLKAATPWRRTRVLHRPVRKQ
jgi:hypothetical protein